MLIKLSDSRRCDDRSYFCAERVLGRHPLCAHPVDQEERHSECVSYNGSDLLCSPSISHSPAHLGQAGPHRNGTKVQAHGASTAIPSNNRELAEPALCSLSYYSNEPLFSGCLHLSMTSWSHQCGRRGIMSHQCTLSSQSLIAQNAVNCCLTLDRNLLENSMTSLIISIAI